MMTTLHSWWTALSARERWLVGIAGILASGLTGWFAIIMPLANGLNAVRERHTLAVERHAGVISRVALADALKNGGAARPMVATGRVDLFLSQSAAEQGFILSRDDAQGESAAIIAIGSATAPALFNWLGTLEAQGITATELSIRSNASGTVALTATMRRAQ